MAACYAVTLVTFKNIMLEIDMDWPKEYSKISQEVRDAAYKLYEVEAITRSVLLPGQVKTAYYNGLLTTDYYLFLFTSRENPKLTGYFTCGLYAADGWFNLNGQKPEDIPSYNPLLANPQVVVKLAEAGLQNNPKLNQIQE